MAYQLPVYGEQFDLSQLNYRRKCTTEILNSAASGVLQYMHGELFMPGSSGMDCSVVKYSGLARNGSLVILSGVKPINKDWQTAHVAIVNMQERDEGLVKLLKKVAVEATRK